MEIRKIYTLLGPNVWSRSPVLEAWVDLGALKDSPSDSLPGFNQRLMAWLPSMIEHRCSIGERGGFFERLRRGTYLAHILEHVTLELQTLAGTEVGFGRARETAEEGVYKVVVGFQEPALALECMKAAKNLLEAAIADTPFDVDAEVKRLRDLANWVCFGPSTGAIVKAAKTRGIPVRRLDGGSLVQFGYGARQHRIHTAETDKTSAIADSIARNKDVTKSLLRSVGVPVPEGRVVESPEDAWIAAEEIGLPVVVKPINANHGRGVTINLTTHEQVTKAYGVALPEGDAVMVEQFAVGAEHRLLVVAGELVAASRGEPEQVVGDGRRNVRELVDELNSDPRRGDDWASPLCKVEVDPMAVLMLEKQGYTPESIPPAGATVLIHHNGELLTDVTDEVHPEAARLAALAAKVVGLDVAGVDMIVPDISRDPRQQGGMIVEVNSGPGLRMHLEPQYGKPRPVAEAILNTLFVEGDTGRIPIVSVTGTNGKTIVVQLIAHVLQSRDLCVGVTSSDGVFVGQSRLASGECTGPHSARAVLLHPDVEAAVLETSRGGLLRGGLAFDRCDVGVVTNIAEGDRVGQHDIDSPERMVFVKRSVIDVVTPQTGMAVLNAEDPLVASMAQYSRGLVTFFAVDPQQPLVIEHRGKGGRAVIVRDGGIVLASGEQETPLVALDRLSWACAGLIRFQVENALAAAAALWALDLPLDVIRRGLESYPYDPRSTGGRFGIVGCQGHSIVLDHCHNVSALRAVAAAFDAMNAHGPRTAIYSAPGDRCEVDFQRQGELLAANFDRVLIYDHDDGHERAPGEIAQLIRRGMQGGRATEVLDAPTFAAAVRTAWERRRPGEVLFIQTGVVESALDTALSILGL